MPGRIRCGPALYTTTIAMDDLDDVRAHLGYEQDQLVRRVIRHACCTRLPAPAWRPHVRSVVLDGVAPPDMRLPLFFARDAQRALDKLVADCDVGCDLPGPVSGARGSHAGAARPSRGDTCPGAPDAPAHWYCGRGDGRCGVCGQHPRGRALLAAHVGPDSGADPRAPTPATFRGCLRSDSSTNAPPRT